MGFDDALEDAIAAAYEVVTLADLETPARILERALGARCALVFTYPDTSAPMFVGGNLAPLMREGYGERHYRGDPLHAALRRLDPRFALHTSEPWLDRASFHRSFAFRDFYERVGAEELAGVWLTKGRYAERDMVGMFWGGGRGLVGGDFGERVESLCLPLRQAARRALLFEGVQRERDVIQLLLTRGASGIDLVHDRYGRTVWLSPRAQRVFPGGRVPARLDDQLSAFRSLRGGRIPARLRCAVGVGSGLTASVFVVPDVPDGPWICATLEPTQAVEALTPAESAVLQRMASGLSNPAIADELGVSLETVRTHVKRIFRKLEASNRTEASRRARELGLAGEEG